MKCLQDAYGKSRTYAQLKEVSQEITYLNTGKRTKEDDVYLKRFYNEEFCSEFSESLKTQIKMIYQEENIITPY